MVFKITREALQNYLKYSIIIIGGDIMNNFDALKQYMIPSNTLNNMLDVYKSIGQNKFLIDTLGDSKYYLMEQGLEKDTFFLASIINLNITDNRMRLLLTKNSNPVNNEEKALVGLKEVLRTIRSDAPNHTFNGSDLLQYLNRIFGKNSHRFTTRNINEVTGINSRAKAPSIRLSYEQMLDDYHQNIVKNSYEKLHLSIIAFLETELMKPFSDHNELASLLALYYMLIRCNLEVFYYISFFELYTNNKNTWENQKQLSYINFPTTHLHITGIIDHLFIMIKQAYKELENIIRTNAYDKRMFKSDGIEQTVYNLPSTFSKEDIRKYHPQVSDSTINRTLFKLRDENIIVPLGKGRSARWVKVIKDDDPRSIFGQSYEISNKN